MSTMWGYNSISSMFSSWGANSSTGMGSGFLGIDLNTYNSIKTGAYKQLLKQYYGTARNTNHSDKSSTKKNTFKDFDVTELSAKKNNATKVKDAASDVVGSAKDLKKASLWEKKDIKKEDGAVVEDYDRDAIYKAVSSFVKDYNSMVQAAGDSNDNSTLRSAYNVINKTDANAKVLKDIGITINYDNTLKIDEETFKAADMTKVKSAFQGAGSFAQSTAASASNLYSNSVSQLAKLQTQNLYNSSGSYNYYSHSYFNQYT